ncbi:hypothetical protein KC660_02260 [Candidatus Dojkabacteria bacterium]|uniref:HMA domain-containing protein n=1 Tax=Candidatus Dojkabacteria bacterium TaxID=2099670 RepID=A0A955L3H2_9BACT|nr:hypothetical protein [Candidatus Dojkabacteria bacterium]
MDKNSTLKVQGMHCDACKTLIEMEIEDLNLQDKLENIDYDSDEQIGDVIFHDLTEEERSVLKQTIENLGNYKIIE